MYYLCPGRVLQLNISAHLDLNLDFLTQMNNLINLYPQNQIALLKMLLIHLDSALIPSILKISSAE